MVITSSYLTQIMEAFFTHKEVNFMQQRVSDDSRQQPRPTQTAENPVSAAEEIENRIRATELAKDARTLDQNSWLFFKETNEQFLNEWFKEQKGDTLCVGWSAKRVDGQIYLVTYALARDDITERVRFEVNLATLAVRNVSGNPALEFKYTETESGQSYIQHSLDAFMQHRAKNLPPDRNNPHRSPVQ